MEKIISDRIKSFKSLSIGDVIYKLTKYNNEKPLYDTIVIKALSVDDGKRLIINPSSSSYGQGYETRISDEDSKGNIVYHSDGEAYTTEFNLVVECFRKSAKQYIEDHEKEILRQHDLIRQVRKSYWEYLNYESETPLKNSKK